jgi:hypothetical protein
MHNSVWLVAVGLIMLWFFIHKARLAAEATEVLQLPWLLHDDEPWTRLDELVLDVARHDVLARWHRDGRQLFLDTPIYDSGVEGGWEVLVDDFGKDITDRYEQLFQTLCALPKKKRNAVLRAAEAKSLEARLEYRNMEIRHPDGTVHEFPSFMICS